MQKIIPHLWFNQNAEEAVNFYVSVFNNGKTLSTSHYTEAGKEIHGMEPGTVLTMEFEIEGYRFTALNGGPYTTINPSISFIINCPTKEEVDELWEKLSKDEGSEALMPLDKYDFSERYGWIQDKYGVSWQIIHMDMIPERKIVPSLMFVGDNYGKAEEAINFYTSVFDNSKIGDIFRYGADQTPDEEGKVMYSDFELEGQKFAAMESAHQHEFDFNEAISFLVMCENQQEIDNYWEQLSAVPESEQCGWLKDKFGVSWQIVPTILDKLLGSSEKEKADRVMESLMQMKKLDIAELRKVYEG